MTDIAEVNTIGQTFLELRELRKDEHIAYLEFLETEISYYEEREDAETNPVVALRIKSLLRHKRVISNLFQAEISHEIASIPEKVLPEVSGRISEMQMHRDKITTYAA